MPRPQFTLHALLVLMLAVTCFFGGVRFDLTEIWETVSLPDREFPCQAAMDSSILMGRQPRPFRGSCRYPRYARRDNRDGGSCLKIRHQLR